MVKVIKFPRNQSGAKITKLPTRKETKKPIPRKKMVETTVYDCPECGTELEKPKDPDVRVIATFYCPNCHYCF
jgi:hypothetical protein